MLQAGFQLQQIGRTAITFMLANNFFYNWVAQEPSIKLVRPDVGGFLPEVLGSIRAVLSAAGMTDCAAAVQRFERAGATDPEQMPDMLSPERRHRGTEIIWASDRKFRACFS